MYICIYICPLPRRTLVWRRPIYIISKIAYWRKHHISLSLSQFGKVCQVTQTFIFCTNFSNCVPTFVLFLIKHRIFNKIYSPSFLLSSTFFLPSLSLLNILNISFLPFLILWIHYSFLFFLFTFLSFPFLSSPFLQLFLFPSSPPPHFPPFSSFLFSY